MSRRGPVAAAVAVALLAAGCGEKQESFTTETSRTLTATTPTVPAKPAPVRVSASRAAAEAAARRAASAALPKRRVVSPGAWKASCKPAAGESWRCRMRGPRLKGNVHCGGLVTVAPYTLSEGESAKAARRRPPKASAAGIRCIRGSAKGP